MAKMKYQPGSNKKNQRSYTTGDSQTMSDDKKKKRVQLNWEGVKEARKKRNKDYDEAFKP